VGQIIYYFIFGVLGACRQAPYKIKKSYGGGFVLGIPIVSTLGTGKPIIFVIDRWLMYLQMLLIAPPA
jgi:hypothetical protein